jgi:hypothetical protein
LAINNQEQRVWVPPPTGNIIMIRLFGMLALKWSILPNEAKSSKRGARFD